MEQRSSLVSEARHGLDVAFKDPQGVGIREHHGSDVGSQFGREILQVDRPVRGAAHRHHRQPTLGSAGGVGPMRGVGDDHLGARVVLVAKVVRLDHAQPRPFPVGSGSGLEGHSLHPGDVTEHPLQLPHQLQGALNGLDRLERVDVRQSIQRGRLFVDGGVVLHGAGPERVGALVEVVVATPEATEVPRQVGLVQSGNLRRTPAPPDGWQGLRQPGAVHTGGGEHRPRAVPARQLEEERLRTSPGGLGTGAHARAPTGTGLAETRLSLVASRSMAAGEVISVAQTKRQRASSGSVPPRG